MAEQQKKKIHQNKFFWFFIILLLILAFIFFYTDASTLLIKSVVYQAGDLIEKKDSEEKIPTIPPLDTALYDQKLIELANNPIPKVVEPPIDPLGHSPTGEAKTGEPLPTPPPKPNLWPVKTVYPKAGAILPFSRVIAYYGNLYSKKMGVLGEYSEDIMLEKLKAEVNAWQTADPNTPVIPALHYIAVVAQGSAGADGKYRARMPDTEIDKVLAMAQKINALVFLDIQVGFSDLPAEVPKLEKYLKMPNVHLGIDPEFSMKTGIRPGKIVGTLDASDINFTAEYLAKIVQENNLTPKILVVHRYTQKMVTNYQAIKPLPEVQIVMHMDGWGGKAKKIGTYKSFIYPEPVQFTGFKMFYKNDTKESGTTIFTPTELLQLNPRPIYIQYQ